MVRSLLRFADGDAFWSAYADALQRTISRQRDERLEQELTLAKRIQQRLLPRSIPKIPGFDVAGRKIFWKIDLYEEPEVKGADGQRATTRVLTIMLAEEW